MAGGWIWPAHAAGRRRWSASGLLADEDLAGVFLEQLDEVEASGGEASRAHLRRGQPVEVISDLIEELGIDLTVVGSRGLGSIKRLVMGSVSEGVIDLAACPVLVVRGGNPLGNL